MSTIALDNDWVLKWGGPQDTSGNATGGTRINTSTGLREPAAGQVGFLGWLSATDGGATIHATLSKTMVESTTVPGLYFAVVDGDALRAQLAAGGVLTYPKVWECFGDSLNVKYTVERKVSLVRRP